MGPDQAGPGRAAVRAVRPGRVHLPDEMGLDRRRRRGRDAHRPARAPARGGHRPGRAPGPDRRRRPGGRDDQDQAPDGRRPEGPAGHRVVTVPRVVIAAPGSGHGKTSVATGLLGALRERGLTVSPHKVGPDYIDPGYHALAAGRPGRNLDPWLVGEDQIVPMFTHGASTPALADIAVIEGVMGLFDGAGNHAASERDDFASTAHVARLLGAPVVLVVDASGVSSSVAALLHGFATFDPATRIGGVLFNQVGSDYHAHLLTAAAERAGVPVLGAIRRLDSLAVPSRHLGLIPAAERGRDALAVVDPLRAAVAARVGLDA